MAAGLRYEERLLTMPAVVWNDHHDVVHLLSGEQRAEVPGMS